MLGGDGAGLSVVRALTMDPGCTVAMTRRHLAYKLSQVRRPRGAQGLSDRRLMAAAGVQVFRGGPLWTNAAGDEVPCMVLETYTSHPWPLYCITNDFTIGKIIFYRGV